MENDYYRQLIIDNLEFIDKQCHKACSKYKRNPSKIIPALEGSDEFGAQTMHVFEAAEIDAVALSNEVLEHLKADNYKVLKDFKNQSKLTTYITTIIANLVIDTIRKHKGRSRVKERAKEMGPLGIRIFELIFEKGFPPSEAYEHLMTMEGVTESFEGFEKMIEKMGGRQTSTAPKMPVTDDTPESILNEKKREELTKNALSQALSELNNEERFIIRIRFPLSDDEEPKTLSEIAKILRITEKAVDSRIRRVLTKCKEKMLKYGLSIEDFVDA